MISIIRVEILCVEKLFAPNYRESLLAQVSLERGQKILKSPDDGRQARGLGAVLLLNAMLKTDLPKAAFPLNFGVEKGGKPYLSDFPEIHFNFSHSGNYVACAVSDFPVGIDVQEYRTRKADVARRFFTQEEQEYIAQSCDKEKAFFQIWALKESFVKANGRGLSLMSKNFSILIGESTRLCQQIDDRNYHLKLYDLKIPYALAVCGLEDICEVPTFRTIESVK